MGSGGKWMESGCGVDGKWMGSGWGVDGEWMGSGLDMDGLENFGFDDFDYIFFGKAVH
jgi:hypothetical protein